MGCALDCLRFAGRVAMVSLNFTRCSASSRITLHNNVLCQPVVPQLLQFLNGSLCRFFRSVSPDEKGTGTHQNFRPISSPIVPRRNWIASRGSSNPFRRRSARIVSRQDCLFLFEYHYLEKADFRMGKMIAATDSAEANKSGRLLG